jgi:hypothetical protein
METQSDSIDITSIKFAALGAFEVSFNPLRKGLHNNG